MLDRPTLRPYSGVVLLTVGNIVTLYGAYLLRDTLHPLLAFALLCLPFFALYVFLETRGYALTKWVGLTPSASIPPLASAGLFAVLGAFWIALVAYA